MEPNYHNKQINMEIKNTDFETSSSNDSMIILNKMQEQ